jgi:hypothetical protein
VICSGPSTLTWTGLPSVLAPPEPPGVVAGCWPGPRAVAGEAGAGPGWGGGEQLRLSWCGRPGDGRAVLAGGAGGFSELDGDRGEVGGGEVVCLSAAQTRVRRGDAGDQAVVREVAGAAVRPVAEKDDCDAEIGAGFGDPAQPVPGCLPRCGDQHHRGGRRAVVVCGAGGPGAGDDHGVELIERRLQRGGN